MDVNHSAIVGKGSVVVLVSHRCYLCEINYCLCVGFMFAVPSLSKSQGRGGLGRVPSPASAVATVEADLAVVHPSSLPIHCEIVSASTLNAGNRVARSKSTSGGAAGGSTMRVWLFCELCMCFFEGVFCVHSCVYVFVLHHQRLSV